MIEHFFVQIFWKLWREHITELLSSQKRWPYTTCMYTDCVSTQKWNWNKSDYIEIKKNKKVGMY